MVGPNLRGLLHGTTTVVIRVGLRFHQAHPRAALTQAPLLSLRAMKARITDKLLLMNLRKGQRKTKRRRSKKKKKMKGKEKKKAKRTHF